MSSEGMPTIRLDTARPAWEYALITITGSGLSNTLNVIDMNRKFDEYGDQGWELVSVVNAVRSGRGAMRLLAVFKRPKR